MMATTYLWNVLWASTEPPWESKTKPAKWLPAASSMTHRGLFPGKAPAVTHLSCHRHSSSFTHNHCILVSVSVNHLSHCKTSLSASIRHCHQQPLSRCWKCNAVLSRPLLEWMPLWSTVVICCLISTWLSIRPWDTGQIIIILFSSSLYNGFYLILTHSFVASKCPLHLNTRTPHFPHLDQKHGHCLSTWAWNHIRSVKTRVEASTNKGKTCTVFRHNLSETRTEQIETYIEPVKIRLEVPPLLLQWVENRSTTLASLSLQHCYNTISLLNSIQVHKLLLIWQIASFICCHALPHQ